MRYYFAPMEGLTDSIYRRLHHAYFPGVDAYYMPFLSPTMHRTLSAKENRELPPAESVPFRAVAQILTRNADDFLWAAALCRDRGYDEVNLNLGCPSGTVVSKGKGAGMLRDRLELVRFLDAIFEKSPLPISVKTRLGLERADEFPALLDVFNRYPIRELTIHPRVRTQFYGGNVDMELFAYAAQNSKNPLCYNGDLTCKADIAAVTRRFPQIQAVMLGRGLIADPGMLSAGGTRIETLEPFLDALLAAYIDAFGGARNAMFRMKENWSYLIGRFDGGEKVGKQLRKTTDVDEYRALTAQILHTLTPKFDLP